MPKRLCLSRDKALKDANYDASRHLHHIKICREKAEEHFNVPTSPTPLAYKVSAMRVGGNGGKDRLISRSQRVLELGEMMSQGAGPLLSPSQITQVIIPSHRVEKGKGFEGSLVF